MPHSNLHVFLISPLLGSLAMSWKLPAYRTPSSMVLSCSLTRPRNLHDDAVPSKSATVHRAAGSNTGYRSRCFHAGFELFSTLGSLVQYGPILTTANVVVSLGRSVALKTSTVMRPTSAVALPPWRCSKYSSSRYARTHTSP